MTYGDIIYNIQTKEINATHQKGLGMCKSKKIKARALAKEKLWRVCPVKSISLQFVSLQLCSDSSKYLLKGYLLISYLQLETLLGNGR